MGDQTRQAPLPEELSWPVTRKWCTRIFASLLIGFVVFLVFLGGIYWFLQRDPQALAKNSLDELERSTGLKCSFGTVIVSLMPLPSVAIYDLQVKGEKADLNVAMLVARPAISDLLKGRFIPASVSLFRPVFSCQVDERLDNFKSIRDLINRVPLSSSGPPQKASGGPPNMPDKISLAISNGRIRMRGLERTGIFGRNLHAEIDFSRGVQFSINLDMARLRLFHQRKPVFALEKLHLATQMQNNIPEVGEFSTAMFIPGWLQKGRLKLSFNKKRGEDGWLMRPEFTGNFTPGKANLPFAISGNVSGVDNRFITFSGMQFQLDADSGQFDMLLKTGSKLADFSAQGSLQLKRASLTEWLGFARNLPPGLQMALDNITRARLEFNLDSHGLSVPSIIATSTGATFTGSGGVADFAKPVVALNLQSPRVNLGLALPEALAETPDPPYFPFEPLTPMPGEPLKEGETGINYDVRLAAEKLIYGPLTLQNASLRIYPGALDKPLMLEDVLLDAKAQLGDGKIAASCILGADPALPCNIKASATGINAASLAKQWKDFPLARGILSANANVFSKGKELAAFLENLNGPVNVGGTNVLPKTGLKSSIGKLDLGCRIKSAKRENGGVSFEGNWQMGANMDLGEIKADGNGRILLDAKGLLLRNIAVNANLDFRNVAGFLPKSFPVRASGTLSGRVDEAVYTVQKLEMDAFGAHLSGNASFNASKLSCSGNAGVDAPNLAASLNQLGMKNVNLPTPMRNLKLQADFAASADRLRLDKLVANFSALKISGNLEVEKKAVPEISFQLSSEAIDLQDFHNSSPSRPGEKWNFSFMKNFNASGNLRIATLQAYGLRFGALNVPLKLNNGKLQLGPARANFCGAMVSSRANADFTRGISFSSVFSAQGFNLGEAARERKIESELSGNASIDANIRADLTGPDQLLKNMDGNWALKVSNGSWQGRKDGRLEGKPVKFSLVSASGTLGNSILKTDNLELKSPDLQVSGKGWMNLEKNTIDSTLNVNMKNVPDFPLYIYGPVEKPKTSIGAGKMMLNAIGGFTSGIANIFGGMVEGVANIFR